MYTYSHMCGTYRSSSIWRSEVSVVLLFLFSETRFLMEHGWNSWLRQTSWPLIPMEMWLLSPMPQHCGYRWVLPPWLLYECWGPEFRSHANAVILHQVSHLSSSFYHSWYWTCLYWKLFILINLIFWQLWSYFLPCHLEISTDVPRLSVRLRAFFPFQLGLLTTPLWPCFTSSPKATITL